MKERRLSVEIEGPDGIGGKVESGCKERFEGASGYKEERWEIHRQDPRVMSVGFPLLSVQRGYRDKSRLCAEERVAGA